MHLATRRPDDVRGVAVIGSALPLQYVGGGDWPRGVPVQEHVGDPRSGHLFNDPTLPEEYDADAAEQLYARLLAFVAR